MAAGKKCTCGPISARRRSASTTWLHFMTLRGTGSNASAHTSDRLELAVRLSGAKKVDGCRVPTRATCGS